MRSRTLWQTNGLRTPARFQGLPALLFCCCAGLYGQATTGLIEGFVTDPSGARVPGAEIVARGDATGVEAHGRSNALGEYAIAGLAPGAYTITVTKEGFKSETSLLLNVSIDRKQRADISLHVADTTNSALVVAAPLLQTQSAETGETIFSGQILNLPLLGRNFLELTRLTPGVASASGGNTLNIAVNGQREFANSILVDGVEASANRNNDTTLRPSVDSVEEFKVLASAYPAEFGRASGAVIAIETRSGGNRLHGSLYEFFRPNVTAARTFFAPSASPLKQHNFGGTTGGPIRKNRTFFFGSYEEVRIRTAFSFLDSVPPANQIRYVPSGVDLSGLKDPFTGNPVPIFDPSFYAANYYASPFPGNVIPANRISPAGKAVLQNLFPAPGLPGIDQGWYSNFNSVQAYAYNSRTASGRLDHVMSEKDRLSAVYHFSAFDSTTGDRFAGRIPIAGGGDADYGDHENARSQQLAISESHTFGGRWLNELRVGYTRYRLDQLSLTNGQNPAAQLGMGNVNLPGFPQTAGLPDIYLGFGAQTGGSIYKPLYFLDANGQVTDTVAARLGSHDLKAGGQFRRLTSNPFFSLFPTGFQFYGGPGSSLTSDPNYAFYDPKAFYYNGGSDIADLLLGLPYTVNLGLQLTNPSTRSWEGSLFAQDTWQATPALTISYGLRYEYAAPWTEVSNRMANFDFTSRAMRTAGGGNSRSLVNADRNNFAPRMGLAWRALPHTVVRAGWGIYYSPENDAREDVLTKNYPFAVAQTVFNDIFGGLPFAYVLDSGVPRLKSGGGVQNVFAVDAGLRTGYSQLYNAAIEREIGSGTTVEAAYVGSASRKLPYAVGNVNIGNRATTSLGQIQALFAEGSAGYNSLQAKARRRWHALTFLAGYTFAKNIDNGPAPFNLGHNQNSHNQPQDPFNLTAERAVADTDVRHSVVASFAYTFHGWALMGIFTSRTGLPVNVVRNGGNTNFPGLRPDILRDPALPDSQRTLSRYFDTKAFDITRFTKGAAQNPGNAGRNLVRGPGMSNLDLSVSRMFRLREGIGLETRVEAFNLSNTPHFANPDGNLSDGSFGAITQTIANPRILQFAAKVTW